ncbi:MAG: hypothetical protein HWQ38_34070 [Nostoc sp. NMS7]|uniref:hypothetical protein n=1 Tax=Nostoc sp. NMS7 TaxID=2815391 RepID=UPI0025D7AB32|nr:hypothetical protein [Nostoc sp. NMS7]MBN3951229.1 hypothetical protein [Nostoc sp. NMS7]
MSATSLLRLRQRQRYFDPTLGDATRSLLPRSGTAKLRATRRSVPNSWRRYANGKLRAGKVSTSQSKDFGLCKSP